MMARKHKRGAALVSAVVLLVAVAVLAGVFLSVQTAGLSAQEAEVQRLRGIAAAAGATQLTLWQITQSDDYQNALARVVREGDTSLEADPLFHVSGDLVGANFDVDIWPGAEALRVRASAAAGGVRVERWAQYPLYLSGTHFEAGTRMVGDSWLPVVLGNTYVNPVVVCTVKYYNNSVPVLVRVRSVMPFGFEMKLQNPAGQSVVLESVSYLVMESGVWNIGGVLCEAHVYNSTTTDRAGRWVGQQQTYQQSYTSPVVVGQVMSTNDEDFSVFWCRGRRAGDPPDSDDLYTGKTVCEDPDRTRAAELVGYIVFEAGHAQFGDVGFEARRGPQTVRGVGNNPPYSYTFASAFAASPQVALASLAGMNGGNGGWAVIYGNVPATATTLFLAVDEEDLHDPERNHAQEHVAYVVFESSLVYP